MADQPIVASPVDAAQGAPFNDIPRSASPVSQERQLSVPIAPRMARSDTAETVTDKTSYIPTSARPRPPIPRALSLIPKTNSNLPVTDDSDEAIARRITGLRDLTYPEKLTPLRAHYLKKALIAAQLQTEIASLSQADALSTFGPPFKPSVQARRTDLPLLRFLFHHFVLTFPFLRSTPSNFFSDKVQVFVERFLDRNISGTDDRAETSKRRRLGGKLEKYTSLLFSAAIRIGGEVGREEVVRIAESDRSRIAAQQERARKVLAGIPVDAFDVNVIGVRTVTTKGRLRSRHHEEFLIRTRRHGVPDTFVSRRYGDFERLAETLRIEFPDDGIRPPPPKDRSHTEVNSTVRQTARDNYERALHERQASSESNAEVREPLGEGISAGNSPKDPAAAMANLHLSEGGRPSSMHSSSNSQSGNLPLPTGPLAREKNRLTLRAYVRSLLAVPDVADSNVLADFLLGEPTDLTASEEEDARVREGLDAVREDEMKRFSDEASERISELREHLDAFKEELVQPDGVSRVFGTIKATPNIEDLPPRYRALIAWARISAASSLFSIFMGSDTSSDLFAQLKRMHGLMPYFVMRGLLRVSNPMSMVRGVLDLFLAQPFGQRSLLQRMFSSSLQDDVRQLSEVCGAVEVKVDDVALTDRVRAFVYANREVQATLRAQATTERLDIMTVILRAETEMLLPHSATTQTPNPSIPTYLAPLTRHQVQRAVRASRAYEVYKAYRARLANPEDDEGPQDEDAWLYEDLHVLLRMLTRLRDKEQMIELIFEGVTAELLKDIVTIFYAPLAQVYKAANIADSLSDLQAFINDLIKTVEASEELSYSEPQRIVQVFIDLVGRHEARFYHFVHSVHSKGSGLFDGIMHWIELFINFVRGGEASETEESGDEEQPTGTRTVKTQAGKVVRRGIGAVDLEVCMPAGGSQRVEALREVDALVIHAYRLKLHREVKLRRRLARKEVEGAASAVDPAAQRTKSTVSDLGLGDDDEFMRAAAENLGVGDMFSKEVEEVEEPEGDSDDEESDEDDEDFEDAREVQPVRKNTRRQRTESETSDAEEGAWVPPASPMVESTNQLALPDEAAKQPPKKPRAPRPPKLVVIPTMVPLFVEMVRPLLRPARTASASSTTSLQDVYAAVAGTGGSLPSVPEQQTQRGDGGLGYQARSSGRSQPPGGWTS